MNPASDPRRRSRLTLIGLAALFFGPLAFAFLLYYGLPGWRPAQSTAHGLLLDPARPLPSAVLRDPAGRPAPGDLWTRHWSFVWVGPGACGAPCVRALDDMRIVQQLLGKDADRIQRIYLYRGSAPGTEVLGAQGPGLRALSVDGPEGLRVLAPFPEPGEEGRGYVVDPHGNLVLCYANADLRSGLLEDTRRLLKYSHIG